MLNFKPQPQAVLKARYFYRTGRWQVTLTGVLDETAARRILQAFGAVTIHAESGMK